LLCFQTSRFFFLSEPDSHDPGRPSVAARIGPRLAARWLEVTVPSTGGLSTEVRAHNSSVSRSLFRRWFLSSVRRVLLKRSATALCKWGSRVPFLLHYSVVIFKLWYFLPQWPSSRLRRGIGCSGTVHFSRALDSILRHLLGYLSFHLFFFFAHELFINAKWTPVFCRDRFLSQSSYISRSCI